jgi:hypothetical protein
MIFEFLKFNFFLDFRRNFNFKCFIFRAFFLFIFRTFLIKVKNLIQNSFFELKNLRLNPPKAAQSPSHIFLFIEDFFFICVESIPMSYSFLFVHELPFCHRRLFWHKQHPSKDRALPVNISTCCFFFDSLSSLFHALLCSCLHIKLASLFF